MTVYASFLDQFLDDYYQQSPPSIPQIHSPGKPTDGQQFWPQPNNRIGNDLGNDQIPNSPIINSSLNSLSSSLSLSSSCHHFYDPNDTFSDLFPSSLPDQEEDWQNFGNLLDGIDEKGTAISSVGDAGTSTTKAMLGGIEQGWVEQKQWGMMMKEMNVEEQPIALRTRSHLPISSAQQIIRQKGEEKAKISFWQQEQIQQWIESVDVEMKKKKKKLNKKRSKTSMMAHKTPRKLLKSRRRDYSRRRKIVKGQNNGKNGDKFVRKPAQISNDESMEEENDKQKQIEDEGKSLEENMPEKVYYCICQRPDDQFSFYVGCDGCNGWFHAECVGTTEEKICAMEDPFFCPKCTTKPSNVMMNE